MGRHELVRESYTARALAPINSKLKNSFVAKKIAQIPSKRNWGFALSAALVLVTVVDPYSGNLAAFASEQTYVNYFELAKDAPVVNVSIARGGYEVVSGSAASKVFVELADIPTKDSVQAIAYAQMGQYGWGRDQYSCLVKLWNRESNWRVNAYNASSGAYGIPQALPGNKMAVEGPDWLTNPATQISWGLGYIKGRYSTPCAALAHSDELHWY